MAGSQTIAQKWISRGGRLFVILIAALILCACASGTPAAGTATPGAQPSQAALVLNSGPLTVTITAPVGESVVNTALVDVTGRAPADTVISIDDAITVVDETGQFAIPVTLEEGPNEIEIVASDAAGNQATASLVVTYEPD